MTLNRSTNEIKTYTGQSFITETFDVEKIRKRIRLFTGAPKLIIDQFLWEVLEDFCEKTWILRKLFQVGDIITEVDNDSKLYLVEIDLTTYADGLLTHDLNEIIVNGKTHLIVKDVYLGDPTGDNDVTGTINDGEIQDGYHYEIVDDTTVKIWPMNLDDVILVPIIFKTSTAATTNNIPYLIEDYYKEIASGVIADIRVMPKYQGDDMSYHEINYRRGISRGKYQYAKQYKGNQIKNTFFAL